ncbi:Uncharacterised protein (plasmid) [Legionella adelaidensis]|uniref:Uncharacterized protein n=1 Tax=Legionella adelaidensis TaxID=45056 RepID=A0A0W0R2Z9_9GAMM|nr:hypothetical protein [Legionella adelaidensis]KTC65437.1 hypothetical protein Lade_0095 [Legionella adelaidensis]VEH84741.1 Uncharacterised protein [Legionella adelaidensis]
MYLTILLVVCASAIVVFFSQEFGNLFKRIFSIPGFKLFVPLILASWLVEYYEELGVKILLWIKIYLHDFMNWIDNLSPIEKNSMLFTHILHLFLFGILPVLILLLVAKAKKRYEPLAHTYVIGMAFWLTFAILLTVHKP